MCPPLALIRLNQMLVLPQLASPPRMESSNPREVYCLPYLQLPERSNYLLSSLSLLYWWDPGKPWDPNKAKRSQHSGGWVSHLLSSDSKSKHWALIRNFVLVSFFSCPSFPFLPSFPSRYSVLCGHWWLHQLAYEWGHRSYWKSYW